MSIAAAIEKIRQAGFTIEADGDYIAIEPFDELSVQQVEWLRDHKPDILDTLRSPGSVLEASQAGSDLEAANDRVAMTRVPNLAQSTGLRNACGSTVPSQNRAPLRSVLRFKLKSGQGGGSLLGSPGTTEAELRAILAQKYPGRLESINGAAT
jgi:hypothetical protein